MLGRMKSKQRSREFWEKAVERAEASSKTRAECARELGVGAPALSYWIYKLRGERRAGRKRSTRQEPCRALVPVRVIDAEPTRSTALGLSIDGMVLRFEEGVSVEYIVGLAGALRRC